MTQILHLGEFVTQILHLGEFVTQFLHLYVHNSQLEGCIVLSNICLTNKTQPAQVWTAGSTVSHKGLLMTGRFSCVTLELECDQSDCGTTRAQKNRRLE